jgi:DNA-binding SARP family transcriptional activator
LIHETPILKSKLCFPEGFKSIGRCRGRSVGKTILEKRLTTITAGAGYGKTTLAVQTLKSVNARIIWLQLDHADGNLNTFLSCLVKGIQKIFPEFRSPARVDCQSESPDDPASEIHFRQLLAELEERLDKDLVLVLDDFHWVQASEAVKALLNFFLRHGSSAFHLVLISRAFIPLSLSRLKAQRQLLEIRSADLVFSRKETALLFKERFQVKWDRNLLDRMYELTQGWVSGLTLFYYAFQDLGMEDIRKCLNLPHPLPDPVADYLEEEVFSQLSSEIKNFLVQTSILMPLKASFCDKFLNIDGSQKMLRHLACFHVFIQKEIPGRDGYVYHMLFGSFLQKKLMALSSKETIADLHRKAARLYEGKGRIEKSLGHFLTAADFKEVIRLLNTNGRRLFQKGKYDVLKTCLDTIPHSYIDDYPWVLCLYGKLQGVCGNHAAATDTYGRALVKFEQHGKAEGINLCRIEIALNYYFAGQFTEAAQVLEKLLTQPAISDELRIEALGYLIFLTTYLRHQDSWNRYYETCQSAMAYLDSVTISSHQKVWLDIYRGHTTLTIGNYEKALEIGRSVEWRVRQQEDLYDFYGHYVLLANACNSLHRFEEGLEYARKGLTGLAQKNSEIIFSIPIWQPAGLTPGGIRDRGRQDTTLPFMLLLAAKNAFGLGRSEESITYAGQSADLFRSMGARWGQVAALNTLCPAYARKGDLALAEQSALTGLSLLKGLDLPSTKGTLTGNLAVVLMMAKRHEEALPLIENARNAFVPFGLSHWADLWLAMYHWHRDQEQGKAQFVSVLTVHAERENYGIVAERHWIVPFLVDIYAQGHLRDYIFTTLKKIGSDAILDLKQILRDAHDTSQKNAASLKSAASSLLWNLPRPDPPGLKIYLLGRFRVLAGDREISADKWGNQKVRSLFQYLAYARLQGYVNRDILIEMLWPDQDPGKTINRFHVTMTALRRVLEPNLPDGAPSSYISRVGDTYRIHLGKEGCIDMAVFTDKMTLADRQKDPYQAFCHSMEAVLAYAGDLLAEAPFCEWCSPTRQTLQNKYLHALKTIIAYYKMQEDFEKCIVYTERYLCVDSTAEKMYCNLMGSYAGTGNLVQVKSTLKRCREIMRLELDCPVEPATEALANRLLTRKQSDAAPR